MKQCHFSVILFSLSLALTAPAQDAPSISPSAQAHAQSGGGVEGFGGNGLIGTVTAVAADHYTIKTGAGERYTVHFSVNTRILKQTIQRPGDGGKGAGPQPLKPSEIKVGDAIGVMGEVDAAAKSIGAMMILQLDPQRARQMREMEASFGKTWLVGKVTAINETRITLIGSVDNAAHSFVAGKHTSFRKHREPVTLADVQVGDRVRVEGAVKDGAFIATDVTVMGMSLGGIPSLPRQSPPK